MRLERAIDRLANIFNGSIRAPSIAQIIYKCRVTFDRVLELYFSRLSILPLPPFLLLTSVSIGVSVVHKLRLYNLRERERERGK